MEIKKRSSGDAVIIPFDSEYPYIWVDGDIIKTVVSQSGVTYVDRYSLEQAIQLLKALSEAVSLAQYNRHQAQLVQDAKAVQE